MKAEILKRCQGVFHEWEGLSITDFEFDDPKGFSSFTMGIRCRKPVTPPAVLYRQLEGKENAILDFEVEKDVFLTLAANDIAARCHYYDTTCRMESFYRGRTLIAEDLFEPDKLRQIANQLFRFHQLMPSSLPQQMFFEMLHDKWGRLAKQVIEEKSAHFPPNERAMCEELREIYSRETLEKVKRCIPDGELTFCHNDTYHGNIMILDSGEVRLLDFEFSCLNNKAYDFSNLFAETVMQHQQAEYPFFRIDEPKFGDREIGLLIGFYLDNAVFPSTEAKNREFRKLLNDSRRMLMLSDYKYAMAALPLAVDPIQKIRFIPYAHQRFTRFLAAHERFTQQNSDAG
jgi:thiamine kinase-like enzyme